MIMLCRVRHKEHAQVKSESVSQQGSYTHSSDLIQLIHLQFTFWGANSEPYQLKNKTNKQANKTNKKHLWVGENLGQVIQTRRAVWVTTQTKQPRFCLHECEGVQLFASLIVARTVTVKDTMDTHTQTPVFCPIPCHGVTEFPSPTCSCQTVNVWADCT